VTTGAKTCACGCGELLVGRRANTRYVNARHRQRAYRRRVQAAMSAHGLPVSLSLQVAQTTSPPTNRNGDARSGLSARQRRRPTPGQVRLSYPKAYALLTDVLRRINVPDPDARARRELDAVLTDRQREALRD
jgi:hypothetical protein